jgi:hypothetical protein
MIVNRPVSLPRGKNGLTARMVFLLLSLTVNKFMDIRQVHMVQKGRTINLCAFDRFWKIAEFECPFSLFFL